MKIVTIIGARPQFIKAAVVTRAIKRKNSIKETIIHTGQHFDKNMSEVFFNELAIPHPNHHLGIGGGSHGQNTGRMIEAIERVLKEEAPDLVLVYGDTDSTLAGALAAVKLHIKLAHVEAGLRSFNRNMPEEINRVLTDHTADLLFTPTQLAVKNLHKEGIQGEQVINVGDVMYDAALFYSTQAEEKSKILSKHLLKKNSYILATIHRQENTDNTSRLASIFEGLRHAHHPIVMPLHPRTKKMIHEFGLKLPDNFIIIDPVGYLDMVLLEKNASLIATDSGGVQKEAYFHKVPCITLRDETEWVELVEIKANRLVGANSKEITHALTSHADFPSVNENLYGDGDAGSYIARIIENS